MANIKKYGFSLFRCAKFVKLKHPRVTEAHPHLLDSQRCCVSPLAPVPIPLQNNSNEKNEEWN
jgi:hypothetical protein